MGALTDRPRAIVVAVLLGVLLLLLQGSRAMPSPDFGINADISGRSQAEQEALAVGNEFATIVDVTVTFNSGYTLLGDVETAVLAVGNGLEAAGQRLAGELQALVADDGPDNVEAAFESVASAIASFNNLMTMELNEQLSQLEVLTGEFIPGMFRDAFVLVVQDLNQLQDALTALQRAVAAARAATGGMGPISSSVLRQYVPSRRVTAVINAIKNSRSRIGALRYVVTSTQTDLETADLFLLDVTAETQEIVELITEEVMPGFTIIVDGLATETFSALLSAISCVLGPQLEGLGELMATLETFEAYESALQGPLEQLLESFSESGQSEVLESLAGQVGAYSSTAVGYQTDLEDFFTGATCEVVRELMLTLIGAGPRNRYCFNKYSDEAFSLYDIYYNSLHTCYGTEFLRLEGLAEALSALVDFILSDVEDLLVHLTVCVELPTNNEACVTTLGGLYTTLAGHVQQKIMLWQGLAENELAANLDRLQLCVRSTEYSLRNTAHSILLNLDGCQARGLPSAGGPP